MLVPTVPLLLSSLELPLVMRHLHHALPLEVVVILAYAQIDVAVVACPVRSDDSRPTRPVCAWLRDDVQAIQHVLVHPLVPPTAVWNAHADAVVLAQPDVRFLDPALRA